VAGWVGAWSKQPGLGLPWPTPAGPDAPRADRPPVRTPRAGVLLPEFPELSKQRQLVVGPLSPPSSSCKSSVLFTSSSGSSAVRNPPCVWARSCRGSPAAPPSPVVLGTACSRGPPVRLPSLAQPPRVVRHPLKSSAIGVQSSAINHEPAVDTDHLSIALHSTRFAPAFAGRRGQIAQCNRSSIPVHARDITSQPISAMAQRGRGRRRRP